MEKRIVEITQTALDDMEEIYDYIADVLLTPENAMGQYNRIADAILTWKVILRDVRFSRQSRNNLGECAEW